MAASKQEPIRAKSKTRETARRLHAILEGQFGSDVVGLEDAVDPYTVVKDPGRFLDVMQFLKTCPELDFDYLRSITGIDWPSDGVLESVYHLYSMAKGHAHVVKLRVPRAAPSLPSVEPIWPAANWFEREAYDLVGLVYVGHSDLRRIMLPDDWIGHPLRKDFVEANDYHGIGTTRASPLEAFAAMDELRRKAAAARGEAPPAPRPSPIKPPPGWVDPKAKKAEAKGKSTKDASEGDAP